MDESKPCQARWPDSMYGHPFGEPGPCYGDAADTRHHHVDDQCATTLTEGHEPVIACHPYQPEATK